uniref:Uncharacterized protein n=1 Tax=Opuntia streptacantha TaxID=393608 RepID=A0A7C8YRS2_OPUST
MDYNVDERNANVPPASILQSDELFSSKILGRQSTMGSCSSRIYHRAPEGVPFQWEMEPGKPITPQSDHILPPPISPPPAILAKGLPKPCVVVDHEPKARKWSRAWLMKRIKKRMGVHKVLSLGGSNIIYNAPDANHDKYESKRYHSELARCSSFSLGSSSSSFTSSSGNSSNGKPSSKELAQEKGFTCRPWGFGGVAVYLVKRA